MADYYITNYGNDKNDGLSLNTPFKSLHKLNDIKVHRNNYYLDGYFNGLQHVNRFYIRYFHGLNNAKIDGNYSYRTEFQYSIFYNLEIFNFKIFAERIVYSTFNCYFHDIEKFYNAYTHSNSNFKYCVFKNVNYISQAGYYPQYSNNTFHNCNYIHVGYYIKQFNIFSNSSIKIFNKTDLQYCLFINCSFLFSGGGLGTDETEYTYPSGTSGDEKLQNLRERMANVYGEYFADYLIGCVYYTGNYEDIFMDADNDDFHLVPGCIAEHMSYNGNYIGAKSSSIHSNINNSFLNNVSTSGYIINQNSDATYESVILDIGSVQKIKNISIQEHLSPYNGIQINTETNLGQISNQNDVLIDDKTYSVLSNNIVLNNLSNDFYVKHDTFITSAETFENDLTFNEYCYEYGTCAYGTSGTNGYDDICGTNGTFVARPNECGTNAEVQEVLLSNNIKKIIIKTSKTDELLSNSNELLIKLNEAPKVNVNILGEPIIGNADLNYNDDTAVSLYTRYIKFFITIKSNNLAIK